MTEADLQREIEALREDADWEQVSEETDRCAAILEVGGRPVVNEESALRPEVKG